MTATFAMPDMSRARAAQLLGLRADASPAEVHVAFRRAIAAAHPDAGGTADAARLVVDARDALLHAGPSRVAETPPPNPIVSDRSRSFTQRTRWWRRMMGR